MPKIHIARDRFDPQTAAALRASGPAEKARACRLKLRLRGYREVRIVDRRAFAVDGPRIRFKRL